MNLEHRLGAVVLAGEQRGQLGLLRPPAQRADRLLQIRRDLLALAGQLQERRGIIGQGLQLSGAVDLLRQA